MNFHKDFQPNFSRFLIAIYQNDFYKDVALGNTK